MDQRGSENMAIDEDAVELARQMLNAACGSMYPVEAIDLETAVIHSMTLLTMGHTVDFQDYDEPPPEIKRWVNDSSVNHVKGLLMFSLRRWHELKNN